MKLKVFLIISLSIFFNTSIASEYYLVDAGDVLDISVWKEEGLEKQILVRPDGYFTFPLAGEIQAKGRSVEEIKTELVSKLDKYIPEPEVDVSIRQISSNKVYVIGKVNTPGAIVMGHDLDVIQALSVAGGTTTFAELNKIQIIRRNGDGQTAIRFRYSDIEKGKNLEQNILLQRGDVIVVP